MPVMSQHRVRRRSRLLTLCAVALLAVMLVASAVLLGRARSVSPSAQAQALVLRERSKTEGCAVREGLPDPDCTPGAVFSEVNASEICRRGYARSVRDVSNDTKRQVYAEYSISSRGRRDYEVDHLIGLELGGSNDIANLWPEAAEPRPGFREKDSVENYLHSQVCSGKMSLQKAQELIASDWHQVYNSMPRS